MLWKKCNCSARERWSRLRLKHPRMIIIQGNSVSGKGAVVSPEIETLCVGFQRMRKWPVARERWSRLRLKQCWHLLYSFSSFVARERWSRLRLKPEDGELLWEARFPWQGSGGLA